VESCSGTEAVRGDSEERFSPSAVRQPLDDSVVAAMNSTGKNLLGNVVQDHVITKGNFET